jgi:putative spermidine/putrescine transport system substrate-binding protein
MFVEEVAMFGRRKCIVAGLVLVAASAAFSTTASAQETIRVMSFGGAYQDAQRVALFKPFEEATGIKVVESTWFADLGKVRAMVEAKNVTADVILGDVAHAITGCNEGFLEPFDLTQFGDKNDYLPGTMWECGVPTELVSVLYAYNEEKVPASWGSARPTTIADMFDTRKFPGKRALSVRAIGGLPEKVLMADGVPPADVYKVLGSEDGLKRFFAKLDSIRDDIVFYTSNAQPAQLLSSGEVAIAQSANGRIYAAIADNKKFVPVWDGQVYYPDVWMIPKGGNKAVATKFLQFITQPKNMAALANQIPYAPVRVSAQQFVSEAMKPYLSTTHDLSKGTLSNMTWWAEHEDEFNKRFQTWLAKK